MRQVFIRGHFKFISISFGRSASLGSDKEMMELRTRRVRTGAGDGEEELELEEPALKRPAVLFEDLDKTVQKTRKGVDKSQRVQKSVKKQVAALRAMRDELKTINDDLVEQLTDTQNNLEKRNQLITQLQAEMKKLQLEQESTQSQIEEVKQYEASVTSELRQQIALLETLNFEMNQVSDEYLELFEDDESRKNVYLDYYASLLKEADFNEQEIEAVKELFDTNSTTVADIKERVDNLENLLDTQDPSEFVDKLRNELLPPKEQVQPSKLKKKKTKK